MAERWFVCLPEERLEIGEGAIRALYPGVEVVREADAARLRARMLAQVPRHASALVGACPGGMTAVNLAATIARDGHADEVVLVDESPSGSLRSRAAQAGLDRVLSYGDLCDAARAGNDADGATGSSRALEPARVAERGGPSCDPVCDEVPFADAGSLDDVDLGWVDDVLDGLELPEASAIGSDDPAPPSDIAPRASVPPGNLPLAGVADVGARGRDSAPVVVVASGRGGVGKSSLVAVAAHRVASWGMRVAVLDLDLGSGNLFGMFGLQGPADLAALLDGRGLSTRDLVSAGVRVTDDVHLWGPCARPEMAETISPMVEGIIAMLSNEYDLVLVDTSTTWTDAVAQSVQVCDRLLLVSDDRWGAVGAMARTAALAVRLGVARTRIMRASNRCDAREGEEGFLYRADVGLEAAQAFRLLDGGEDVGELLRSGHAADLAVMNNDFSDSAATWLARVLEELGRLPDCKDATESLSARVPRRAHGFFARMREVG